MVPKEFKLLREQYIPELNTRALLYLHHQTEAQVLFLKNQDENKVFGITFRTPPKDSTGLPHILEHSVLCGSRKYPVKEPFVELLKGSLQTFLNAFTYPDKTCYPVASTHPKDFHHLIDVYLDAVFYPLITPQVFFQEGWHYHQESLDSPLEIRGVVYNEMKGAYSSPERVLVETIQQSLFPDHPYSFDSGGDPFVIPQLTYDQFINFHKTFYHPSNSKIFFYGNGSIEEELSHLNEYLKDFTALAVNSQVPPATPFRGMRLVEKPYAVLPGSGDGRFFATFNVLLPETTDIEKNIAFQILNYILLGMPGSPLRKALIDSGLGEDIAGPGLEIELRNLYFSTGLRGIRERDRVDDMLSLIENTLRKLVREGIPKSTIESAVNTIEFRYRECHTGNYPRGLVLMLTALTTWLYDGDPLALIAFERPFERIKRAIESDNRYFESLIEEHLLENQHRSLVVLFPDESLIERLVIEERRFIESYVKTLSLEERQEIIEKTRRLKEHQERVDNPEDLKKIPRIGREDLSIEPPVVPKEVQILEEGSLLIKHALQTHGIVYLDLGFNFEHLDKDLLPYLSLFCSAILEMGTVKRDFVEMSERIARFTGGIRPKLLIQRGFSNDTFYLFLRGKALTRNFDKLLEIFREIITEAIFDDSERFLQILLRHKATREGRLIPEGHKMALHRIRAHFGRPERVKELLSGISQYMLLKEWSEGFNRERWWYRIRDVLYTMRETLFRRSNMIVNLTCEEDEMPKTFAMLGDLLPYISNGRTDRQSTWDFPDLFPFEAFGVPAQVHYVGKGGPVEFDGMNIPGWFLVVIHHARTSWLWDKVRVQGGAYGVHCFLDRPSKTLVMTSYRDPHLVETEEVFDKTWDFLRRSSLTEDELVRSIIGTYGRLDPPMFPDDLAYTSIIRYLIGETDEMRRAIREEILNTSVDHFTKASEVLKNWAQGAITKVLGPLESLERVASSEWRDRQVKIFVC
ncbi:MAG: insulinase family protein [Syntrophobacterales bacterium]|nr:insulinase family protein [Syntrophobacterales bacterium]